MSILVFMVDHERKWCHFNFKGTEILFLTVLFIREEWLSLFTLLNADLSRQFCSEMLLKIGENTF